MFAQIVPSLAGESSEMQPTSRLDWSSRVMSSQQQRRQDKEAAEEQRADKWTTLMMSSKGEKSDESDANKSIVELQQIETHNNKHGLVSKGRRKVSQPTDRFGLGRRRFTFSGKCAMMVLVVSVCENCFTCWLSEQLASSLKLSLIILLTVTRDKRNLLTFRGHTN